jgi:hypothetical protein
MASSANKHNDCRDSSLLIFMDLVIIWLAAVYGLIL